ncbi:EthD domain-containing protein [Aspergillus vadensis CBS 113365]|uniref:EthD domain-containing protein n=1 Tax=Aspergillus vadensis (strain CBS 113365 / IMI 142717 / IBT 24658) TaxID=1448311 RepID=A0A319BHS3_ASPVC|nr:hypothetical protein BO88DRAFT_450796 [Aspergillus vadensis CBS 113365]PYH72187.1 hypothetical protein BO88DRAFT_450796 [Aspergillus vadensis CBS 113365]
MPIIKQLIALRRKAGLTREEFFDYHYQVHGALSKGPSPSETPLKYFQTHFLDTAYHVDPSQKIPNAHPAWAFNDGLTELYFSSEEHMIQNFASEWVKTKVGPDGANFSDFGAVKPMFVREEVVPLTAIESATSTRERSFVGMYFVALSDVQRSGEKNGEMIDKFTSLLKQHASTEVLELVVNVPTEVGFDLSAYFGGGRSVPAYYVFMTVLRGKDSVSAVRKVQGIFEDEYAGVLDLPATWIGFGERAVVLDQSEGIEFDPKRQPYKKE